MRLASKPTRHQLFVVALATILATSGLSAIVFRVPRLATSPLWVKVLIVLLLLAFVLWTSWESQRKTRIESAEAYLSGVGGFAKILVSRDSIPKGRKWSGAFQIINGKPTPAKNAAIAQEYERLGLLLNHGAAGHPLLLPLGSRFRCRMWELRLIGPRGAQVNTGAAFFVLAPMTSTVRSTETQEDQGVAQQWLDFLNSEKQIDQGEVVGRHEYSTYFRVRVVDSNMNTVGLLTVDSNGSKGPRSKDAQPLLEVLQSCLGSVYRHADGVKRSDLQSASVFKR